MWVHKNVQSISFFSHLLGLCVCLVQSDSVTHWDLGGPCQASFLAAD